MKIPEFKAPKFALEARRVVEIPFYGSIGAGAFLTLVSNRISYPFRVTRLKMIFDELANNLVTHQWLTSGNRNVSTTGPPSGDLIGRRESTTPTFTGRGLIRVVDLNDEYPEGDLFIKLYTFNGLGVAYPINASCTIEAMI